MPLIPEVKMFLYILTDPASDIALIETEIDTFVKSVGVLNRTTNLRVTSTISSNLACQELVNQGDVVIQDLSGDDQCVSGEHLYMVVTVSWNSGAP